MHRFTFVVAGFAALCVRFAVAADVPPLTAAELSPAAGPIWLFLAGEGFWGAIVLGVAGFVYKMARPYVLAWVGERKLAKLYLAVEACVAQTQAVYVEGMKAANSDGKLTEDEKDEVLSACRRAVVAHMRTQGVDVLKEYGDAFVDALIELVLSRLQNPLVKAVARPLPDSAPLPPSVSEGATPA